MSEANELAEVAEHLPNAPVPQNIGIAAISLQMAMKYHDTTLIKDGAMYQAKKLEGVNFTPLHLDMVFDTAKEIEKHLVEGNDRIAGLMMGTIDKVLTQLIDEHKSITETLKQIREGKASELLAETEITIFFDRVKDGGELVESGLVALWFYVEVETGITEEEFNNLLGDEREEIGKAVAKSLMAMREGNPHLSNLAAKMRLLTDGKTSELIQLNDQEIYFDQVGDYGRSEAGIKVLWAQVAGDGMEDQELFDKFLGDNREMFGNIIADYIDPNTVKGDEV